MGSGSLLLTVQEELKNGDEKGRVKFYGQELNTTTYNLARMNLMMHQVDYQNMSLRNADTLESDWPDGAVDGIDRHVVSTLWSQILLTPQSGTTTTTR